VKKFKWVFIVLGLIVLVVLTMPKSGLVICVHEYEYSDNCTVQRCTKCNYISRYNSPQHSFNQVDCMTKVCTNCGKTESGQFHYYKKVACTMKLACTVCNHTVYSNTYYHPNQVTHVENCKGVVTCKDCNMKIRTYTSHNWVSDNCEVAFYCKDCGSTEYPYKGLRHRYDESFFGFFDICEECGHVSFQIPEFRYVAAFIGLLMSFAALIFIFINRRRISVQGGKYIRIATPDAHLKEEEIF